MIQKIKQEQQFEILDVLKNAYFQNPYLYIDAVSFGFSGENIQTHILYDNGVIAAVIYKYYNSLQICAVKENVSVSEIAKFIKEHNFDMISGNGTIIKSLEQELKDCYVAHLGSIMVFPKNTKVKQASNASVAQFNDCGEIARLICSDEDIGGHYAPEVLQKQLEERMVHFGCKNTIITENGEIVAHAATYAECSEFAIIGGVITSPKCRGKGYGAEVVSFLTGRLLLENKQPLLYCYEPKTVKWYEKIGWEIRTQCGKLERKKNVL